jgi:hypothetical protein
MDWTLWVGLYGIFMIEEYDTKPREFERVLLRIVSGGGAAAVEWRAFVDSNEIIVEFL